MRELLQSPYQVHDDAHHESMIHVVSKQEFKKVRMGVCGGVHSRGNSPPWLQVPIDSEEGREGCILL